MSIINEALKKAERERATEQGSLPPMPGIKARVAKRAPPMKTQKILLIVAGGLLLVVVSAVLTGVFVTQKVEERRAPAKRPAPTTTVASVRAAKAPAAAVAVPAVATAAPASAPAAAVPPVPATVVARNPVSPAPPPAAGSAPTPTKSVASQPMRAESADASMTLSSSGGYTSGSPSASSPAQAGQVYAAAAAPATAPAPAGPRHDPKIQALVDGFRVSGIRSAGTGSKVLMNDRVFRVNDIVDYFTGLKLVGVTPETLTFADANGEVYIKNL